MTFHLARKNLWESRVTMRTSLRLRRSLQVVAIIATVFLLLETVGWIAAGRDQVPSGLVKRMAELNHGRFRIDEASLSRIPPSIRSQLRSDLIRHQDLVVTRYERMYPNETPADLPVPKLKVDSWRSTPLFASVSAHIAEGRLGEGFTLRYVWSIISWVHAPLLDIYWIT